MTKTGRDFPDWDALYKNQEVKFMPWYNEQLDSDLEEELENKKVHHGKFLDIGTGPGTQAIRLCERGLHVTATDLSETAITNAKSLYNHHNANTSVNFMVDDILNTNLKENEFDYIFDRGCFHVISVNERKRYLMGVKRILRANRGILFLKCFSDKEQGENGPYRFSKDKITKIFENEGFEIESIKDTVYQGTLNPLPKALFVVMTVKK
jgi:cyclopropane fatty-acyl-phospholipid synthase-like methyltransferase